MKIFCIDDGVCSLWPELNFHFLSLNGIPQYLLPTTGAQAVLRELLAGCDAITSCELKDLYRFKLILQALDKSEINRPELQFLAEAFHAWVDLDYSRARMLFRRHLQQFPADVVALYCTHMFDFCTGQTPELLDDLESCGAHITAGHPLYSFYLSIKAFVLCETGQAPQGLTIGLESVRHYPTNIYGIHAVAHAMHEQERWQELCAFLEQCKAEWIDNPGMRMHVGWHLALAYLNVQKVERSVQAFHEMYALKDSPFARQDLDAVAYLWRFRLAYPENRQFDVLWKKLAAFWSGSTGSSMSYFHRLHAALAFAASNQPLLIEKLIAESDGFGLDESTHHIGLAVLRAILHFTKGQKQDCYRLLRSVQDKWGVLGGSRAQRELLLLTLQACVSHRHDIEYEYE